MGLQARVFNVIAAALLLLFAYGAVVGWPAVRLLEVLGSVVVAAFAGNLDRIKSFKASATGVEAETHAIVAATKDALAELRHLATTTGEVLVGLIAGEGRWGGMAYAEKDRLKAELLATLKAIGVTDVDLASVAARDAPYVLVDYCAGVTDNFSMPGREGPPAWEAFWSSWKDLERPPAVELRAFLSKLGTLETWRAELLADYEHYQKTGKHRRPSVWAARGQWHDWTAEKTWPAEHSFGRR